MGLVTSQSGGPGTYTTEMGPNQAKVYQGVTKVGEVVAYGYTFQMVGSIILGFLLLLFIAYIVYNSPSSSFNGGKSAFTNVPRSYWQVPL